MPNLAIEFPRDWRRRAGQMLVGGAASIIASVAVTNMVRIVSSMALTRLLDSTAYGVVGIVTTVAYMLSMLTDTGIIPFVVRHDRVDDPRFLDEVWTIRFVRGVVLTIVMAVVAAPIAMFLGKPPLTAVIVAWSFSFLLDGGTSLAFATAIREQRLWRLSILDLIVSVSSMILSIAAAIVLRSYWAMMIGMLGSQAIRVVLSYRLFPQSRRRLIVSRERSREVWRFSRNIALSSALSLFILQIDKVMLARMMPLATFGLYAIATTLATAPEAIAGPYAGRILYPAYANAAKAARASLGPIYYRTRRNVALLYAFGVGGLIGGAPILVGILYDPRYAGVSLLLQMLAVRVLLRLPNMAGYELTIALGDTRTGLTGNIVRTLWLLAGGAVAVVRGEPLLLVAVVATDEWPATLLYWAVLKREKVLDLRREAAYFVVALAGLAIGFGLWQGWTALRR